MQSRGDRGAHQRGQFALAWPGITVDRRQRGFRVARVHHQFRDAGGESVERAEKARVEGVAAIEREAGKLDALNDVWAPGGRGYGDAVELGGQTCRAGGAPALDGNADVYAGGGRDRLDGGPHAW
jgi:hypothetical protein